MKAKVFPSRGRGCSLCRAVLFALAALAAPHAGAQPRPEVRPADGPWLEVRSANFRLVGHAGEAELRLLAARLEEFRAALSPLLGRDYFDAAPPTVFVVFRDEAEYAPVAPLHRGATAGGVGGHFQHGREVSYVALSAGGAGGGAGGESLRAAAFHEYVHSLVRNRLSRPPLWLTEGLAEYFSTAELATGGAHVRLGKILPGRAARLRTHAPLPLVALLAADHDSPLYTNREDRSTFYAQSWALVHYLSADEARRAQLSSYLESLASGASPEESFVRAFPAGAAQLELGLRAYVRAARFDAHTRPLPARPSFDPASRARAPSEAEMLSTLGDLLLRAGRDAEAAPYLGRALALDPNLAPAHAALGLLHLRANRLTDAHAHLLRALASDPADYLARYHFAQLLRLEATDEDSTVAGFADRTRRLREELKQVVALAPDFLDAQALLAAVEIERSPQLEEADSIVARALAAAPRRREFALLAARIRLRREEFAVARAELEAVLSDARADAAVRAEARYVLDSIPAQEEAARLRGGPVVATALQPCDMPEPGPQAKLLRFAGEQVCGRLVAVECDEAGVALKVTAAGGRTLMFRSEALGRIRFISYTKDVRGRVECGPRADSVLITYRPAPRDPAAPPSDGTVTAVEFLPDGLDR